MSKIFLIFLFLIPVISIASSRTYVTTKTKATIVIDGYVDEEIWKSVPWQSDFTMFYPYDDRPATKKTSFAIIYDNNFIYVAMKAFEPDPEKIVERLTRRDDIDGDWMAVQFDSYHDLQTSYEFKVSAAGTKSDMYTSANGDNSDRSWDAIWWAKTAIVADGWTLEMKIPFSQLRFVNRSVQIWGLQLGRYVQTDEETSLWAQKKRDDAGWVQHFGTMEGIVDIKPKKVFDLYPYVVGSMETYKKEDENPFLDGFDLEGNAGLDGKIGLTNNLTLDFTINPDFGQVEADPSRISLSGFEQFFREQRPFFVEGSSIINFPIMFNDGGLGVENLFYSRRIGRRPHHDPDLADENNYKEYAKLPNYTRILGAAKISGRTRKGLSIGVLESATAKEYADIEDSDGNTRRELVEPLTNYSVISVEQDINKGNTLIGGMLTSTNRVIDEPHLEDLRSNAYSGGVSFTQHWKQKIWYLSGRAMFSHVDGSADAIRNTQESAVHYYQRPDANHFTFDTTRTSLSGTGANLFFGKEGGGRWRFGAAMFLKSPGFETNDIGFVRHSDEMTEVAWLNYVIHEPFFIFKDMYLGTDQWTSTDFNGNFIATGTSFNFGTTFTNNYHLEFGGNGQSHENSNTYLQGGPFYTIPWEVSTWFWIGSDYRKMVHVYANYFYGTGKDNWRTVNEYRFGFTIKPLHFIELKVNASYKPKKVNQQFVTNTDYGNNKRYILGTIDQETTNLSLRVNCNITPDISIQYWGQPFIATGTYSSFKYVSDGTSSNYNQRFILYNTNALDGQLSYNTDSEEYLIDENTDGEIDYNFEDPDYNAKVFLSNMVFRWEYRPGSVFFLVWSQNRENYDVYSDYTFADNVRNTFNFQAHNTFLVKLSYRIGI